MQHPFPRKGRGWVAAQELNPGDLLTTDHAEFFAEVEATALTYRVVPVYNLSVEHDHTYFVSNDDWDFGVWAHNTYNKAAVDEAIENGVLSIRKTPGRAPIHHIATDKDEVYTPLFKKIFNEGGVSLQSAWNRTRVPGHVGPHGYYNQFVLERLQRAIAGTSGAAYRTALLDELYLLRREILNGDLRNLLRASS